MTIPAKKRHPAQRFAICLVLSLVVGAWWYVYFIRPAPSEGYLAHVVIDLNELDGDLTIGDLRAVGLSRGFPCWRCDFSRGASVAFHFDDLGYEIRTSILRMEGDPNRIHLNLFARDVATGREQLEESIEALRARFPGEEHAIVVNPSPAIAQHR